MFENLTEELKLWGELLASEYKDKLNNEGITASGKLANSVQVLFNNRGSLYEVSLQLESYWKQIEEGRGPTQNDGNGELRQAILNWIRIKPVAPRPYNGKLPTENQLAYLISRKIHTLGYEGKQPLKRTLSENKDAIYRDIENALCKDLENNIGLIFKEIGF